MIEKLTIFSQTTLPTLLAIFVVVLSTILLIRAILSVILHFARKKYKKLIQYTKKRKKKHPKDENQEPFDKEDSELFRKMEEEKTLDKNVAKITSEEEQQAMEELKEVKIVDIVKPVGFFTSMILGQKLTYLVSSAKIMNKNSNKGFWVSMVEAQERAAGRERGKGRW